MTKQKEQERGKPTRLEDSVIVGILIAKEHKVIPVPDEKRRVHYDVYGDVEKSLREIYENKPIGSLDVINGIKSARGMIWNLKGGAR